MRPCFKDTPLGRRECVNCPSAYGGGWLATMESMSVVFPWGCLVISPERLIKITGISVAEHVGGLFYGQLRCLKQRGGPFHSLLQEDFGEFFLFPLYPDFSFPRTVRR